MATYPIRNRILAQAKPTSYWASATAPGGEVEDILHPGDPNWMMVYDAATTAYSADRPWGESGRSMINTNAITAYQLWNRQVFENGKAFITQVKLFAQTSFPASDMSRDLISIMPVNPTGVDDQAFVLTAVHESATGNMVLHGQVYSGGAWSTYDSVNLGKWAGSTKLDLYIQVYHDPVNYEVTIDLMIPGLRGFRAAALFSAGGDLKFAQINSAALLASYRPDIGLPPITGTALRVAFCFAANLPAKIPDEKFWELAKVDMVGFSVNVNDPLWPYDNSKGVLLSGVAADVDTVTLEVSVEQAKSFRAPGPMERAAVTIVDGTGARERCLLTGVDVLNGQLSVTRGPTAFGDPMLAWPASTEVRGLLLSSMNDLPIPDGAILPGIDFEPTANATAVMVYESPISLSFAGDDWTIRFPNGRRLMLEEVMVVADGGVDTAASIQVGTPADPDSLLAATVVPVLPGDGNVWVAPGTPSRKPENAIKVTVSGGSGYNRVMLKGAFLPL